MHHTRRLRVRVERVSLRVNTRTRFLATRRGSEYAKQWIFTGTRKLFKIRQIRQVRQIRQIRHSPR